MNLCNMNWPLFPHVETPVSTERNNKNNIDKCLSDEYRDIKNIVVNF